MRKFGTDLRFPTYARRRLRRAGIGRWRFRRSFEDELQSEQLGPEPVMITVDDLGIKTAKITEPLQSLLTIYGAEGCPCVLARQSWVRMEGYVVEQWRAQGAPIPRPGGMAFWYHDGDVFQFRWLDPTKPLVDWRRCTFVGKKDSIPAMIAKLNAQKGCG